QLLAALDRVGGRNRARDELHLGVEHNCPKQSGADDRLLSSARAVRQPTKAHGQPHYASASLQNWKHFFTSVRESLAPRYSYSIKARIGHFLSRKSCRTGLIGVSPWPHGMFAP